MGYIWKKTFFFFIQIRSGAAAEQVHALSGSDSRRGVVAFAPPQDGTAGRPDESACAHGDGRRRARRAEQIRRWFARRPFRVTPPVAEVRGHSRAPKKFREELITEEVVKSLSLF